MITFLHRGCLLQSCNHRLQATNSDFTRSWHKYWYGNLGLALLGIAFTAACVTQLIAVLTNKINHDLKSNVRIVLLCVELQHLLLSLVVAAGSPARSCCSVSACGRVLSSLCACLCALSR